MKPNIIFGLTNIACALLIIGICIPLVKRKIKMNSWYGVRIPKSFESEENWYRINAYGGKELIIWSIPIMLSGVLCFFIPGEYQHKEILTLILGFGPLVISLMITVIRTLLFASKL
jgi:hypothetical protein